MGLRVPISWRWGGGMRRTYVRHVKMPGMYVRYAGRPASPDELQTTHIMKDTGGMASQGLV